MSLLSSSEKLTNRSSIFLKQQQQQQQQQQQEQEQEEEEEEAEEAEEAEEETNKLTSQQANTSQPINQPTRFLDLNQHLPWDAASRSTSLGRPCVKSQGSHLALALSSALWGIQFVEMRRLEKPGKHGMKWMFFLLEMGVFLGGEILKEIFFFWYESDVKSHQVWSVNTC